MPTTQSNFLSCMLFTDASPKVMAFGRLSENASRFAMRAILAEDLLLQTLCLVESTKCLFTLVVMLETTQRTHVYLFARLVKALLGNQTTTKGQRLVLGFRSEVEGWNPSMCFDPPVNESESIAILYAIELVIDGLPLA